MEAKPPQFNLTSDGLHLDGTILWLDAKKSGDLSFLSSCMPNIDQKGPKLIATEITLKMLSGKNQKPKALVCQYNRPFSIGKLKMELLPSGAALGGASLYVETGQNSNFLYAPQLLGQKNSTARQMQLKEAETLILRADHPDPTAALPNRKKEKERLVKALNQYVEKGIYPVILCKAMPTAQEITNLLSEAQIPVAVHSAIFRLNHVYEQFGSPLGQYSLHRPRKKRQKVLILPHLQKGRAKMVVPDGPLFYIEDKIHETQAPEAFRHVTERFYIGTSCDGKELKDIIHMVNPKIVYLFGPYTKRYTQLLEGVGPEIRPLYSNGQPTLF